MKAALLSLLLRSTVLAASIKNKLLVLSGVMLLCAGCSPTYIADKTPQRLPCKMQGACDVDIIKYKIRLNKKGVTIINIGEQYLISIPASALFRNNSPQLYWQSYALINEVAQFLKLFRKVTVYITAYSGKYVSKDREYALTKARSQAVGNYLWSQGIDSRFIFTQGKGSDKPIADAPQVGDRSKNSRIEITFSNSLV